MRRIPICLNTIGHRHVGVRVDATATAGISPALEVKPAVVVGDKVAFAIVSPQRDVTGNAGQAHTGLRDTRISTKNRARPGP